MCVYRAEPSLGPLGFWAHRRLDDLNLFLGHDTVEDAE